MPYTNTGGGYYIPNRYTPKRPVVGRTTPNAQNAPGSARNLQQQLDFSSFSPQDVRSPLNYRAAVRQSGVVPGSVYNNPFEFTRGFEDYTSQLRGQGVQQTQPIFPQLPGSPGSGRSGGGGGGGGPAGIDQATFDWLMAQLQNKPAMISYRDLDLPDPSQYMKWDPTLFNTTRQGLTSGLAGIQQRADTEYDRALGELNRYVNPYAAGPTQANSDYAARFGAMAQANDAMGQMQQTVGEGAQADRAFGNVFALMSANDQARQAANLRALEGDRRTTAQNLGLEGNLLNLGVNMAEARGKTSFDQALQRAMFDTASQEAMQNYTRRNEVEAGNVGTLNAWQQNVLNQILGLVGSKAAGTKLPGDMSWLSVIAPGINLQGGSYPIPPVPA